MSQSPTYVDNFPIPAPTRLLSGARGVPRRGRRPIPVIESQPQPAIQKSFRFTAKTLFATFPKCAITKETALANILAEWGTNVNFAIVAAEKHEDGTPHLHCVIKFNNYVKSTKADFADFIGESHGNYQSTKNLRAAIEYVKKDGDYVTHGTVPFADKKVSKFDDIANKLDAGASISQIKKEYPGLFLMQRQKISAYFAVATQERASKAKSKWAGVCEPNPLLEPEKYAIAHWLNTNVKRKREFKQKQLWITAPANHGKTTMVLDLENYLNIYHMPLDEEFYDGFDENMYDMVVLDEYKAQKRIQFLNTFVQGSTMPLRIKGAQTLKSKEKGNLPVIVLSNYTIEGCYSKADSMIIDTLKARFLEVTLPEGSFLKFDYEEAGFADSDEEYNAGTDDEE